MGIPRRRKLLRFLVCETIAIIVLIASIGAGVRERHARLSVNAGESVPPISPVVTVLTISAAVAVGLIPTIFYGPERLH